MKVAISKCLAVGMAVGLSFGAFAEDAYVEANGTQCVAVDCQPTEKTRYEVDFQFTTEAVQKSAVVLGWENSGNCQRAAMGSDPIDRKLLTTSATVCCCLIRWFVGSSVRS